MHDVEDLPEHPAIRHLVRPVSLDILDELVKRALRPVMLTVVFGGEIGPLFICKQRPARHLSLEVVLLVLRANVVQRVPAMSVEHVGRRIRVPTDPVSDDYVLEERAVQHSGRCAVPDERQA